MKETETAKEYKEFYDRPQNKMNQFDTLADGIINLVK